jgi:hypothetical protein
MRTPHAIYLLDPADAAPDLTTRGSLLRYAHLRAEGFAGDLAEVLADAGYDVVGFALVDA